MDAALKEALETLHDFREFVADNMGDFRQGAGPNNPMWQRVADVLIKHQMQDTAPPIGIHGSSAYFRYDRAYTCI